MAREKLANARIEGAALREVLFARHGAVPTLHRFDGWFGGPEEVPDSVVRLIVGEMPSVVPRSVAEATRARMIARQLKYELSRKAALVRRKRFGLEIR